MFVWPNARGGGGVPGGAGFSERPHGPGRAPTLDGMTAPEVGAHRPQLDAAVGALALQVNRETVLAARAALLAEAERLDRRVWLSGTGDMTLAGAAAIPSRPKPPLPSTNGSTPSSRIASPTTATSVRSERTRRYSAGLWLHRRQIAASFRHLTHDQVAAALRRLLWCSLATSAVTGSPTPVPTRPAVAATPARTTHRRDRPLQDANVGPAADTGSAVLATTHPTGTADRGCDWVHSPSEPVETYTRRHQYARRGRTRVRAAPARVHHGRRLRRSADTRSLQLRRARLHRQRRCSATARPCRSATSTTARPCP